VLAAFIVLLGVYPMCLTHFYTDVSDSMAKKAATRVSSDFTM